MLLKFVLTLNCCAPYGIVGVVGFVVGGNNGDEGQNDDSELEYCVQV